MGADNAVDWSFDRTLINGFGQAGASAVGGPIHRQPKVQDFKNYRRRAHPLFRRGGTGLLPRIHRRYGTAPHPILGAVVTRRERRASL